MSSDTPSTRKSWLVWLVLAPLALAAGVSLRVGLRHATQYGQDLQWMGSRLVFQHIDPWQETLANYPHNYPHLGEPNYLHLLYLLLFPLNRLSFHGAEIAWAATSTFLSVLCIAVLARLFRLSLFSAALALCLLWMSSPFRVVLQCGQIAFFELLFLTLAFLCASSSAAGLSLGVSFIKYSFSPAATLLFLLRGRFTLLVYAALVPVLALLGVWLFVRTPIPHLALEPFLVSAMPNAVSPGFADLMTYAERVLDLHRDPNQARRIAYGLGLAGSAAYALLLSRFRLSRSEEFTLISVASLFFVKHLVYDYVFLVVLLCFALSLRSPRAKAVLAGAVLFFWFFLTFLDRSAGHVAAVPFWQLTLNFSMLALLLTGITWFILSGAHHPGLSRDEEAEALLTRAGALR